jgi:site-specific DNA recombinase
MKPSVRYCAIYTRKSSEEGLEQEFNSLDAQREACEAYILSQRAEGWTAVKKIYDDGGFSGGNVERPGLQQLLNDIRAGKVHIVVVYKIDRLTRSLMDFAKLVEVFDQYSVTFVSVTQSFNTTTSMGRLTLNVLLSFAQFEREVTGERIRDKIAASKKKGMWMGGTPPIGYDVKDRRLVPHEDHAKFIRMIYERYLELESICHLKDDFKKRNIKSPVRTSAKGNENGDCYFTRGSLQHILRNPIFIGKIRHKDKTYDGQHPPIMSEELWNKVQQKLMSNAVQMRGTRRLPSEPKPLQGKIYDIEGNLYSPSFANMRGKIYRYYISQNLLQYRDHPKGVIARIPAYEIEIFVHNVVLDLLRDHQKAADLLGLDTERDYQALNVISENLTDLTDIVTSVQRVVVDVDMLTIKIKAADLCKYLSRTLKLKLDMPEEKEIYELTLPYITKRALKGVVIIRPDKKKEDLFDLPPQELRNLIRGFVWRTEHFKGKTIRQIAETEGFSDAFVGRLITSTLEAA